MSGGLRVFRVVVGCVFMFHLCGNAHGLKECEYVITWPFSALSCGGWLSTVASWCEVHPRGPFGAPARYLEIFYFYEEQRLNAAHGFKQAVCGGCFLSVVVYFASWSGSFVKCRFGFYGEFDPGSGRTLAACLTHASRTMMPCLQGGLVANG